MELISDALFSFQRRGSTDGNARGCHLEESVSQTGFIMWNAAIPWYPIYLAIEILFVFLNPDKPPRSLWCGIWVTVVVLLGAALVASAALSVAVSRIFRAFDTTDCFRCGSPKAQRLSIQKQQQLRVFVFFAFLTLAMFGVVGCFHYSGYKHCLFGTDSIQYDCPAILNENCSITTGVQRSVAITCCSLQSFCLLAASFLLLNAAWMGPIVLMYWPPPIALLLLTWVATAWNILLWDRVWGRLVNNFDRHYAPASSALSKAEGWIGSRHPRIAGMLAVLVWLGATQGFKVCKMMPRSSDKKILYSLARQDQTGAQILEMLLHSAYAHQRGASYGGACIVAEDGGDSNATKTQETTIDFIRNNISHWGLNDQYLKFDCPKSGLKNNDPSIVWRGLPWILGKHILTSEWLDLLQSQFVGVAHPGVQNAEGVVVATKKEEELLDVKSTRNNPSLVIAVHIRRGDISPCKLHRYLPNQYYLDMIDRYRAIAVDRPEHAHKTVEVIIHSTVSSSFESLDIFRELNYTVKLEQETADVWMDFILADVFIMSQSSFSVVPALLNRHGIVVFAPYVFFGQGMPGWETIAPRELWRYKQQDALDLITAESCSVLLPLKRNSGSSDNEHYFYSFHHPAGVVGQSSGVWYVLRNFGMEGIRRFFQPNDDVEDEVGSSTGIPEDSRAEFELPSK